MSDLPTDCRTYDLIRDQWTFCYRGTHLVSGEAVHAMRGEMFDELARMLDAGRRSELEEEDRLTEFST